MAKKKVSKKKRAKKVVVKKVEDVKNFLQAKRQFAKKQAAYFNKRFSR